MEFISTNDDDIVHMDHQGDTYFLKGFGIIDSTVKSQSILPAQNQNASINKVLNHNNILEPLQYSSGTLDTNYLPNQATAVNSQTSSACTRSMVSSVSDERQARIQAILEDPAANISSFKEYCNQDGDMAEANTNQDFVDLIDIIGNEQNGIVVNECQDTQEVLAESGDVSQIPLPVHSMTQDNIQQQNSNTSMAMNTVNQSGGGQVVINFASYNILNKQRATLSLINQGNSENKYQYSQLIDPKPATNLSVSMEENAPFQNMSVALNSNHLPNKATSVNPNVIHVSWPDTTDFPNQASALITHTPAPCTQSTRPMKSKTNRTGIVGRCPQGVLALYLQPEPENEQDKRKWRRAKTAHEHRENKKNALVNDGNMIKDLMKEMDELKNQLDVVTAERDSYKNTLNNLMNNGPRYS